ncbi:MAG: aminotransferase class I/II-fold pyridoxal phosphate-dependent enzyme [Desulfobacteraceae bacterium]|nr:aminotransferase class I/II-fold pyridoxal phosphate-dependent enzyme [Desulfobacteraceae bacterium]
MHICAAPPEDRRSPIYRQDLTTLIALLLWRAEEFGNRTGYIFLQDGESQEICLTYGELGQRVFSVAASLQSSGKPGDRVLLLCPPGLEFIVSFFGTICAGLVPVPAYPPHSNQTLARLEAIASDARPALALATSQILDRVEQQWANNPPFSGMRCLAVEDISLSSASEWRAPACDGDSLAFIQYTSGSTGSPRGVLVSHANLLHNSALIRDLFGHPSEFRGVSWLPPYHDMGLGGSIVHPLHVGGLAVLMSPFHFLQRPSRWLEAITRYRATISGGPNFAYDLCVRKIAPEQRESLDLSSWDVAYNGAEPIRAETMERFIAAFGPCGFRRSAFRTCYGLAESTLIVTGQARETRHKELHVNARSLQTDKLVPVSPGSENGTVLVGCGKAARGIDLLIVDPETRRPSGDGEIGEIWVAGPSVAKGYWEQPEETSLVFAATVSGTAGGPFLRTGDLGALHEGNLFVTGRLKDLIIIRGRNHYPQDIELTVEKSHPALRPGCGAAFSVDLDGEERLVIVQEVERKYLRGLDAEEIVGAVREAVSSRHELQAYVVVLIKTTTIPKTSSGKIQRRLCRALFLRDELNVVARRTGLQENSADTDRDFSNARHGNGGNDPERYAEEVLASLREQVARLVRINPEAVDPGKPITALGIDSLMAVELKLSVETETGTEIPVEAIFAGASIGDLAAHIAWQRSAGARDPDGGPLAGVLTRHESGKSDSPWNGPAREACEVKPECYNFEDFPELRNLRRIFHGMGEQKVDNPYFKVYGGINRDTAEVEGGEFITFSSYNYLGLSGHPAVSQAAREAVERYGTSVSASRIASGERPLHRELERELAELIGTGDCLTFVSGHATNVTTVGHLFGSDDLILYDALIHNSGLQGCTLSGAAGQVFPHNDFHAVERVLQASRSRYRRVLILIEGLYSMDGDIPDLPAFIDVKKRYKTLLMVDEAHSAGVLGERGRGIGEHFSVNPADVDLWMGTLSKSFASCGGYIAGNAALVEYLKYTAPGFVYSVGMTPANAAAALAAVKLLKAEPERVALLRSRAGIFWEGARAKGFDTGISNGLPIVPVIVGHSVKAMRLSQALFKEGIDVLPMVYPAVPDRAARLRFFISCTHTVEQIRHTLDVLERCYASLK